MRKRRDESNSYRVGKIDPAAVSNGEFTGAERHNARQKINCRRTTACLKLDWMQLSQGPSSSAQLGELANLLSAA
jgi:hypothetical protein